MNEVKNNTDIERIYVSAGSHTAYLDFVRGNGLDRNQYRYIDKAEAVRGLLRPKVVFLRSFWDNPNHYEISAMLRARGAIEVKIPCAT
jgi:aspartate/tyrosine/aromatic aminotransferase